MAVPHTVEMNVQDLGGRGVERRRKGLQPAVWPKGTRAYCCSDDVKRGCFAFRTDRFCLSLKKVRDVKESAVCFWTRQVGALAPHFCGVCGGRIRFGDMDSTFGVGRQQQYRQSSVGRVNA